MYNNRRAGPTERDQYDHSGFDPDDSSDLVNAGNLGPFDPSAFEYQNPPVPSGTTTTGASSHQGYRMNSANLARYSAQQQLLYPGPQLPPARHHSGVIDPAQLMSVPMQTYANVGSSSSGSLRNTRASAAHPQVPQRLQSQASLSQGCSHGIANRYVPQHSSERHSGSQYETTPDGEDVVYDDDDKLFGEDEDMDEEAEVADYSDLEQSDLDNGEFVVRNTRKKPNVERPGTIRNTNGFLEWQDGNQQWHRAVIHHNIRRQLIDEARAANPGQRYNFPEEVGPGPNDTTSYHPRYKHWGSKRESRPKILFQFDPPDPSPHAIRPGPMRWQGMVVLNHQNNPVLDWDIPATLSSRTSGAFMQGWIRLLNLGQEDLRARMPRFTFRMKNGVRVKQPLPDKNSCINMHIIRFRGRSGSVAWQTRGCSEKNRARTLALFRSHNFDPLLTNSTEGFGRDLTIDEEQAVKDGNRGTCLNKAGSRRIGSAERKKREVKDREKRAKRNAILPVENAPSSSKRRQSSEEPAPETDGDEAPQQLSRRLRPQRRAPIIEDEDADAEGEIDEEWVEANRASQNASLTAGTSPNLARQIQSAAAAANPILATLEQNPLFHQLQASKRKTEGLVRKVAEEFSDDEEPLRKRRAISRKPQKASSSYKQLTQNINPAVQPLRRSQRQPARQHHRERAQRPSPMPLRIFGRDKAVSSPRYTLETSRRLATPLQESPVQMDCRTLAPENEADRNAIDAALEATLEAFYEWVGNVAPNTDRNLSYMSRWEQIHGEFVQYDWEEQIDGQVPYLPQSPPWYTNIEDWPPHVKDSLYFEAWTRGFRAPRAVDGTLIELSGDFLEAINRLDEKDRDELLDRAVKGKGFKRNV